MDTSTFVTFITTLLAALVLWLVMAYSNQYATEFIKTFSRWLLGEIPWLNTVVKSKHFGFVVAGYLAWYISFNFGVDILGMFESFSTIDPSLMAVVNAILIALGANAKNDGKLKMPTPV